MEWCLFYLLLKVNINSLQMNPSVICILIIGLYNTGHAMVQDFAQLVEGQL